MKKVAKSLISLILALSVCIGMGSTVFASWVRNRDITWSYLDASDKKVTGWLKLSSTWYFFDEIGAMQTGWEYINGKWYYFDRNGRMQTGWKVLSGKWYYLSPSGEMKTGWNYINNAWFYLNGDGSMKTGWFFDKNWYYFSPNGLMKTGWVKVDGSWYYLNKDGTMKTGWLNLYSRDYYLFENGKMAIGFNTINGVPHYFNSDGILSDETFAKKNKYEQKVLSLVNEIRLDLGLNPLSYSISLSLGADRRSEEITLKFDHVRPNGSNWYTVFTEIGQSPDGTGENIAKNFPSPESVVQNWMDSASHRQNILNPNFRYLGISYLEKMSGSNYWVQLFAETVY